MSGFADEPEVDRVPAEDATLTPGVWNVPLDYPPGALRATETDPASGRTGRDRPAVPEKPRAHASPVPADLREPLGRVAYESEGTWWREHLTAPHPERAKWEDLSDEVRELYRIVGDAAASYALTENAITLGTGCVRCGVVLDRATEERERAERAEAKVAEIVKLCRSHPQLAGAALPQLPADILAIIGSEEAGHGR